MKRISRSPRFVPLLFSAFLVLTALVFGLGLMNGAYGKTSIFLVAVCAMPFIGYFVWKIGTRNLVDEVYDCGDFLVVRKSGEEDMVTLSNIVNVDFSALDKNGFDTRITLTLASPGKFGGTLTFAPPLQIYTCPYPTRNEIADDLRNRAYWARSGHAV